MEKSSLSRMSRKIERRGGKWEEEEGEGTSEGKQGGTMCRKMGKRSGPEYLERC